MTALVHELLGSEIGLLSLFTISFLISMGLFLWWRFTSLANRKD